MLAKIQREQGAIDVGTQEGLRLQDVVEGVYEANDAFPGITRSFGSIEQEWISTTGLSLFKKDQTCDQGQAIVFATNSSSKESGISSPLRRLPRELASNNLPFVWFL